MLEVISSANAVKGVDRHSTLFPAETYSSPVVAGRYNTKDAAHKTSPYYIRKKFELGILMEIFTLPWIKYLVMVILVLYMYGAMCLKYSSGSESFVAGMSSTIYNDPDKWTKVSPVDPYYCNYIVLTI